MIARKTPIIMSQNVWNLRQAANGNVRTQNYARPWYRYGLELLQGLEPAPGRRVLDVGCGVGEFLELMGRADARVVGIDGNVAQMASVSKRNLRGAVSDLENALPFADATFALVTCLEVIEHIATAERLLAEIARVLKPQGYLLLTTPNFAFLNNRLYYLRGLPPVNEGTHLRFFTRAHLEACLAGAGLQIVARNCYGVLPGVSTITTRLLQKPEVLWRVPPSLESILAYDLIYLARKQS